MPKCTKCIEPEPTLRLVNSIQQLDTLYSVLGDKPYSTLMEYSIFECPKCGRLYYSETELSGINITRIPKE